MLSTAVTCVGLHGIVTWNGGKPATCCQAASAQTPASGPLLAQELCPGPGNCSRVICIDGRCPGTVGSPALVQRREWAEHSGDCCSVRQGMCGTHFALVCGTWYKFWSTNQTQHCMAQHNTHHTTQPCLQHSTALHCIATLGTNSAHSLPGCLWLLQNPVVVAIWLTTVGQMISPMASFSVDTHPWCLRMSILEFLIQVHIFVLVASLDLLGSAIFFQGHDPLDFFVLPLSYRWRFFLLSLSGGLVYTCVLVPTRKYLERCEQRRIHVA